MDSATEILVNGAVELSLDVAVAFDDTATVVLLAGVEELDGVAAVAVY